MRRFFAKNLLFTIITNVLIMPAWVFFISRNVQVRVPAADFGVYASLSSLTLIFITLLDFGIVNYNTRIISRNPGELKTLFPAMLWARFVLIFIYVAILLVIGLVFKYSLWEMLLLSGIILIQVFTYLVQFLRSNVAALHHFKTDSILSVSARLLMILVCGFLLLYPPTAHHFKIEWYVETQVACYLITAVVAYLVLNRIQPVPLRFSFHWPTLWKIMKDSFPYALLIFLMSIYTRSDQWLLKQIGGPTGNVQSNTYYAAYQYLDVANMFALMFASILLPLFGRMLAERQPVNQIVELCINMLLPVSFMVAIAAVYFSIPIMHLIFPAATDNRGYIFAWVMASFPAFCIMYVYSTLLTANGNIKKLNKLAFAGVIINLSLNFYLIPRYHSLGAAITGLVTQSFMAVGFIIACIKEVNLSVHIKRVLAHISFLLLIAGIGYATTLIPMQWMIQLGVFGVVCVVLMFVFRFVSLGAVKQMMMNKQQG